MKAKAIGLLSGGLDSTLATKLMLDQDIEVIALNFVTPFCTCTRKGCKHAASQVARRFGIKVKTIAAGNDYIKVVKAPMYRYGKNMNPCIDCRIFMLRKAGEYMREVGASFIFTGEVLNQRPMSQKRKSIKLIEREAGLEGLIVRPLSARFFEPTIPEKEGLISRDSLLAIEGRGRIKQMELAEKYNIKDYPCPAGGCRLTDPQFARKVREAFEHNEDSIMVMKLLKYGRHFRLPGGARLVVGRNEKENAFISGFARENDVLLEVVGHGSPTALLKNDYDNKDLEIAASICARYSDCDTGLAEVRLRHGGEENSIAVKISNKRYELFKI